MSKYLYQLGRTAARRPWRMIGVWLVIATIVLTLDADGATTATMEAVEL